MATIRPVSGNYHVSDQLQPSDLESLARAGYSIVVCMRPDDEVPEQPSWKLLAAAAEEQGLAFHYIPARSGAVTPEQAAKLRSVLIAANGRVLAYCASGNRCTMAHQMAQSLQDS